MAVEGIGNLPQLFADQLPGQPPISPAAAKAPGASNNAAPTEDIYIPSTQSNSAQATGRDAGIFQVNQGALTAITPNILFAQAAPKADQNGAAALVAAAANAIEGNVPSAAASRNIPANPGLLFAAKPGVQTTAAKAEPVANVQEQIQLLNAELPVLGLSAVQIQEIDRLATVIQNFNPGTYSNLVSQFEAQTQQPTQPSAANAATNAIPDPSQNTPKATKANGNGAQA